MGATSSAAILLIAVLGANAEPPLTFEVASVKPIDRNHASAPYRIGPSSLTIDATLKDFIMLAYDVQDYQVDGGQAWARSDFYAIRAKASGPVTRKEICSMFQSLLADRFRLKIRREQRMFDGYVLIVDNKGPKLPRSRTDLPPNSAGVIQLGGGEIWARGATLTALARGIRFELEKPVLDQTHIEGNFDIKLRFDEANRELRASNDTGSAGIGSIFTALHEIGLKLEARKLPIEVLVVESAQQPADN
jgi:uncharacterized protein (TIGR03435 family)